jgi:hypothetical protein
MNSSNHNLITFKAISSFVTELSEIFSEKNHSLKLYARLLNKTTLSHEVAIKKHIESFRIFCFDNRDALENKKYELFKNSSVEYSSKVFIDFSNIFKEADSETKNIIWKHLLTIAALVDPAGKAREILKNSKESKEANFLSDILEKVETNVTPNSNPLEAVSSIMSSGIFTELISNMNTGIQDGSLDLGKLMGTVQQMCTSLNVDGGTGGGEGMEETLNSTPMNMLTSMMSSMGKPGEGGAPPDLSGLTSLLGPMLSTLSQNQPSKEVSKVEEISEK